MDLWSISFIIEDNYKHLFSEQLEDFGGYISSSLFTTDSLDKKKEYGNFFKSFLSNNLGEFHQNQLWILEAIFDQKPLDQKVMLKINSLAKELNKIKYNIKKDKFNNETVLNQIKINKIDNKDWLKDNRRQFPIINIDNFYIYGSHITKDCLINKKPIKIDASTAFGTGSHATTECCLKAIAYLSKFTTPKKILDYGCGTGILGISSKKIFKNSKITLVDIDKNAVKLAKVNLKLNNIKTKNVYLTNTYFNRHYMHSNHYNLVFANILFIPLFRLAPVFKKIMKYNSFLILSGVLEEQVPYITNRYNQFGFREEKKIITNGWGLLIMNLKH